MRAQAARASEAARPPLAAEPLRRLPLRRRGDTWERLDGNGLPSGFGFPLALDPDDPDVAYVIPEQSQEHHSTAEGRLGVYRHRRRRGSWDLVANGLPSVPGQPSCARASAYDDGGVYFGTQGGSIWAAPRGADRWTEGRARPPPILSVEAAAASVPTVRLPAMLAAEADGRKTFDVEAGTVGEALRQLPVSNLLFDETGELRALINVFVDGVDVRGGSGLDEAVGVDSEVRVVGAVAGG